MGNFLLLASCSLNANMNKKKSTCTHENTWVFFSSFLLQVSTFCYIDVVVIKIIKRWRVLNGNGWWKETQRLLYRYCIIVHYSLFSMKKERNCGGTKPIYYIMNKGCPCQYWIQYLVVVPRRKKKYYYY